MPIVNVKPITRGFVDIVPPGRTRACGPAKRDGVAFGVYAKQKTDNSRGKYPSLTICVRGTTLERLRWRAGDRIWFQLDPERPQMMRVRRTEDGVGSLLCYNNSKSPEAGLKTSVTVRAFGAEEVGPTPLADAEIVSIEKDAVIVKLPESVMPAVHPSSGLPRIASL